LLAAPIAGLELLLFTVVVWLKGRWKKRRGRLKAERAQKARENRKQATPPAKSAAATAPAATPPDSPRRASSHERASRLCGRASIISHELRLCEDSCALEAALVASAPPPDEHTPSTLSTHSPRERARRCSAPEASFEKSCVPSARKLPEPAALARRTPGADGDCATGAAEETPAPASPPGAQRSGGCTWAAGGSAVAQPSPRDDRRYPKALQVLGATVDDVKREKALRVLGEAPGREEPAATAQAAPASTAAPASADLEAERPEGEAAPQAVAEGRYRPVGNRQALAAAYTMIEWQKERQFDQMRRQLAEQPGRAGASGAGDLTA